MWSNTRSAGPRASILEIAQQKTFIDEKDPDETVSKDNRRGSDRKKLIVDVRFDGGDGTGIANTRDI